MNLTTGRRVRLLQQNRRLKLPSPNYTSSPISTPPESSSTAVDCHLRILPTGESKLNTNRNWRTSSKTNAFLRNIVANLHTLLPRQCSQHLFQESPPLWLVPAPADGNFFSLPPRTSRIFCLDWTPCRSIFPPWAPFSSYSVNMI
ncbi:hypothetical protein M413DRAFT_119724 [Hebeloma cylindrosporum]|uniref:Uncharacterized protein n=1 Tax=Hebeloma cylindrosporum TaxID=76867 RepID=A0A0C3CEA2_HEBCY|nr:hypothetical protein M413DRAFT_119724 [Hebeloma cylindrosporum h7]